MGSNGTRPRCSAIKKMKIKFSLPKDSKRHRYCLNCFSENVTDIVLKGKRLYRCDSCHQIHDRLIDIDPALKWWVDKKTGEYHHESVGMIVIGFDNRILFFERTIFPYGHTSPAGHLEINEKPEIAALRELKEETGLSLSKAKLFKEEDLPGDPCRRGADFHFWHLYVTKLNASFIPIIAKDEGKKPIWLDLNQALKRKLTPPVRYFLEKYKNEITDSLL